MSTAGITPQPKLKIRPEEPADEPAIRQVHRAAFGGDGEANLVDALRREAGHRPELSLVAVLDDGSPDGRIVGHIMFSAISIGESPGLALAPVAVLPDFQNRGYGSQLIHKGLAACRALKLPVVVLGHADYYPRFGFERASKYGITAPFEVSDNVFLVYAGEPGQLAGVTGQVRYSAAFALV